MLSQYTRQISQYIRAKDDNKPHLMPTVFADNAQLRMQVNSENISFPAETSGLSEITQTLIRGFNQSYENIYTICLRDSLEQRARAIDCRWIVAMTESSTGLTRVGFGDYLWLFADNDSNLVNHLTITIQDMQLFDEQYQSAIMSCFSRLSYPWGATSEVLAAVSEVAILSEIYGQMCAQKALS